MKMCFCFYIFRRSPSWVGEKFWFADEADNKVLFFGRLLFDEALIQIV
jgi:hypothetical protein